MPSRFLSIQLPISSACALSTNSLFPCQYYCWRESLVPCIEHRIAPIVCIPFDTVCSLQLLVASAAASAVFCAFGDDAAVVALRRVFATTPMRSRRGWTSCARSRRSRYSRITSASAGTSFSRWQVLSHGRERSLWRHSSVVLTCSTCGPHTLKGVPAPTQTFKSRRAWICVRTSVSDKYSWCGA